MNIINKSVCPASLILWGGLTFILLSSFSYCLENNTIRKTSDGHYVHKMDLQAESLRNNDTILRYKLNRGVYFKALPTRKVQSLSSLRKKYGEDGVKLILALSRVDEKLFRKADTLIVPSVMANILSFSPFPFIIEQARDIPKLILISRKLQAIAAYEHGTLVHWGPTSTGRREKPTPEGLFSMNWKAKKTTSTIDDDWVLPYYFNFNNKEGVALHQFEMPGYPASHACVRLWESDAKWFFYWGDQWVLDQEGRFVAHGTPVIVFDEFRWGKRKTWRGLLENSNSARVTQNEVDNLMEKYLPNIKERTEKRETYLADIKRKKEILKKAKEYIVVPMPLMSAKPVNTGDLSN